MADVLDLLKELLPVWLILLLLGFGYLIVLFKRTSDRFIDLASQQSRFMQERVDVLDKSTGVFERTIKAQDNEIEKLNEKITRLSTEQTTAIKTESEQSAEELRVLSASIERLAAGQQMLFQTMSQRSGSHQVAESVDSKLYKVSGDLEHLFSQAILAREKSAAVATLKSDLRNLVTAEEAYFGDNVKYTSSLRDLGFTPSPGVGIPELTVTGDGFIEIAQHLATKLRYCIFVGSTGRFGHQREGEPFPVP